MKKLISCFSVLFILLLLTGCKSTNVQYINYSTKPNNFYYTNDIYQKITRDEKYKLQVFDENVYKYFDVAPEDYNLLKEFIESLDKNSFVEKIDSKIDPKYKLIIEFENIKYIINAYDEKTITVYPWDGVFEEDRLSMEGVPDYYNIYKYCEYIIKKGQNQDY